ncbi:MAG: methyltransferase domain-containing protein [Armatimonas sp.]
MPFEVPLVEARVNAGGRDWNLLRVKDQDALIAQVQTEEDLALFPFGLMLWASAVALADAIPSTPGRLLELGAGVGLAGLAARHKGWEVVQTDYDTRALELCETNARRNGITGIDVRVGDWREWPDLLLNGFDLVIGADVLYERTLHPVLRSLLPKFHCPILISDPLRPQATDFFQSIEADGWKAAMGMRQVTWDEDPRQIALFQLTAQE